MTRQHQGNIIKKTKKRLSLMKGIEIFLKKNKQNERIWS